MSVIGSVRSSGVVDCNSFNEVGVTDGLIAYFDANNSGSVRSGDRTWYNLILNQPNVAMQGTAVTSSYASGSYGFNFTTTGQLFFGPWPANKGQSASDMTLEAVFMPAAVDAQADDRACIILISGTSSIYHSWNKSTLKQSNYWYDHPTNGYFENGPALARQQWHHTVAVWNFNDQMVYQWCNGVKYTSSPTSGSSYPSGSLYIGNEGFTTRQFTGYLSIVKIYGRALTDAEVMINYGIYKDQFNTL